MLQAHAESISSSTQYDFWEFNEMFSNGWWYSYLSLDMDCILTAKWDIWVTACIGFYIVIIALDNILTLFMVYATVAVHLLIFPIDNSCT